jgi:hypothetical protein
MIINQAAHHPTREMGFQPRFVEPVVMAFLLDESWIVFRTAV